MAVDEIKAPTRGELLWFGLVLLLVFGVIGAVVWWQTGSLSAPRVLWGVGAGLAAFYYLVPPMRIPLYLLWMHALFPIRWLVSHLLLGAVYFLVITPLGLLTRAFGRDKLARRLDRSATSYWIEQPPRTDSARYLRQS